MGAAAPTETTREGAAPGATTFGRGGHHGPENLALMCRAHNALMAEHDYGKEVMARFRRSASRALGPVAVGEASGAGVAVRLRGHSPR
jgi:hypothetical protein